MSIKDLSHNEYLELCQRYYMKNVNANPSYFELTAADGLIDRSNIEKEYSGVNFSKDDFFCNL